MFFYLLCSCTVRKLAKKITLCLLSGKEFIPLQGQHVPQHDLHSLCHILRLSIDTFKHCRIDGVSRQSQKNSLFNIFFVFCRLGIDVRKTHTTGMPGGDIYTSGSIYNRIPGDTLSDQHSMIRYGSLFYCSRTHFHPRNASSVCLCSLENEREGMGRLSIGQ